MLEKPFEELNTLVNIWTLPSCKYWLKTRGYVHDGNRSVLRGYIIQLKSDRSNPPTLLGYDLSTVSKASECIGHFLSMVSSIMSRGVSIPRTTYEMEI